MSLREHGIIHITRVPQDQVSKLELQQQALHRSRANEQSARKTKAQSATAGECDCDDLLDCPPGNKLAQGMPRRCDLLLSPQNLRVVDVGIVAEVFALNPFIGEPAIRNVLDRAAVHRLLGRLLSPIEQHLNK
jgi:hypothetical protein